MTQGNLNPSPSLADLSTLPPDLAEIVTWMLNHPAVTLPQVCEYFGIDEILARDRLEALVERRFVGVVYGSNPPLYQLQMQVEPLATSEDSLAVYEADRSLATKAKPLVLIANPSGEVAISAGKTFELRVTLSNQGDRGAVIALYIDETSQPLYNWCSTPYERLALSPQQSCEVVFRFAIPLLAAPRRYSYCLVVDAPDHYPEATPIRHQGTLQIQPPIDSQTRVNDPTFSLVPATSSEKPAPLQPGQIFTVRAVVHNRSDRVDRFRLTCSDFPPDWVSVIYPEGINELGLVVDSDSLALNPGAKGEIRVNFQLPAEINAGKYVPTLQLASDNNPDLVLLDVVYLEALSQFNLSFNLRTIVGKIEREDGRFELRTTNRGNTHREIAISAREDREKPIFDYRLVPDRLKIGREETVPMEIVVTPQRRWQRPWWGRGREYPFYLDLQDLYRHPLPVDPLEGRIVWLARPWWHLLLAILAGAGAIAGIIFLIWWFFFRPPTPPRILEFASEAPRYQAVNDEFIHLNWRITQPKRLQSLQIVGVSPQGATTTRSQTYDLSKGLPESLKEFCTLKRQLVCSNVRTDARQPGDYVFTLTAIPKRNDIRPIQAKSNRITIAPLPKPKILAVQAIARRVQLTPSRPANAPPQPPQEVPAVLLSWQVLHPEQIGELHLIGRLANGTVGSPLQKWDWRTGIPESFQKFCRAVEDKLTCSQVPLIIERPGEYTFELAVFPKQGTEEASDRQKADTVEIEAPEPPKILAFDAAQPVYEAGRGPLRLNWEIANPLEMGALEVVARSPEGAVIVPKQQYTFRQGIPEALQEFCRMSKVVLVCQNLPTSAATPGSYIFELSLLPGDPLSPAIASQKSNLTKIVPQPTSFRVSEFTIDGRPVPLKYRVAVDPRSPAQPTIQVSWKIEGKANVKVELLPIPGTVSTTGSLDYPIRKQSGQQTLTLQVTSDRGEQVQRSVIIETVALPDPVSPTTPGSPPNIPPLPPGTLPPLPPTPGSSPGSPPLSPSPISPEEFVLPPIEDSGDSPLQVPPEFD